jgi:sugar phosphate permease
VVQTAANWTKVERRGAILGLLSTCYAVGNVLAWLLAGFLVDAVGWRAAFAVPALIALPVAAAIGLFLRNDPRTPGCPGSGTTASTRARRRGTIARPSAPWPCCG